MALQALAKRIKRGEIGQRIGRRQIEKLAPMISQISR
jgi:hypothetical protein